MTATPETTVDTQPGPSTCLTAMCHSIIHAIELAKVGNLYEAGEHVDAIERLIASYWTSMGEPQRVPGRVATPIGEDFPQGAAAGRLKEALKEFRATQARNTLADDLQTVLEYLEFTREDIAQLRKAWAAVTWCLMEQARHKELTDAHLADVPSSHRPYLLGRDAIRRQLLAVVAERDALRAEKDGA